MAYTDGSIFIGFLCLVSTIFTFLAGIFGVLAVKDKNCKESIAILLLTFQILSSIFQLGLFICELDLMHFSGFRIFTHSFIFGVSIC